MQPRNPSCVVMQSCCVVSLHIFIYIHCTSQEIPLATYTTLEHTTLPYKFNDNFKTDYWAWDVVLSLTYKFDFSQSENLIWDIHKTELGRTCTLMHKALDRSDQIRPGSCSFMHSIHTCIYECMQYLYEWLKCITLYIYTHVLHVYFLACWCT